MLLSLRPWSIFVRLPFPTPTTIIYYYWYMAWSPDWPGNLEYRTHYSTKIVSSILQRKNWSRLDLLNIPQSGGEMSKRLGGFIGCKYKTSLMVVTLGQQYNTGEKPTAMLCVCVCFLPIHSGHQVRWTYQPGSHRRKVTQDFSSTFFLRCVP